MAAKVLQFKQRPIRLTKEILIPGRVTFDYDDPLDALDQARRCYDKQQISSRVLAWVTDQILERLVKIGEVTHGEM